ncbi:hypothetical protein, partial [Klebsiella variicola]
QRSQNRSEQDALPIQWEIKQVVWAGDVFDTISSREASELWRERMGWDVLSKADKAKQKAREGEENKKHYQAMTS